MAEHENGNQPLLTLWPSWPCLHPSTDRPFPSKKRRDQGRIGGGEGGWDDENEVWSCVSHILSQVIYCLYGHLILLSLCNRNWNSGKFYIEPRRRMIWLHRRPLCLPGEPWLFCHYTLKDISYVDIYVLRDTLAVINNNHWAWFCSQSSSSP